MPDTTLDHDTLRRRLADGRPIGDASIPDLVGEIDRLRSALKKIADRWPCDNADTMSRLAKEAIGL